MLSNLRRFLTAASALLVLVTLACNDDDKNPTTPETPEPPEMVTQTFSDSVPQRGETCHFFTLGADGSITLQITDLQPLTSITMGLAVGVPSESDAQGCSRVVVDNSVRMLEIFLSSGNLAGEYCACVFDVGNIFPGETVTYDLDVTHPR